MRISDWSSDVCSSDLIESPERFDYIVVVGGLLHGKTRASSNVNVFLKSAARARVPLIGLCTGSFILARAGLLDGYQICVSWFHIGEFKDEFPSLRAESSQIGTASCRERVRQIV